MFVFGEQNHVCFHRCCRPPNLALSDSCGSLVMMISTWRKMSCKKNAAGATLAATKDWKYWMSWYQFNLLIWKLRFRIQTTSREDSQRFFFVRFLFMRNEPFKIADSSNNPTSKTTKKLADSLAWLQLFGDDAALAEKSRKHRFGSGKKTNGRCIPWASKSVFKATLSHIAMQPGTTKLGTKHHQNVHK